MGNKLTRLTVALAAFLATIALGVSLYLSFYGNIPSDTAFVYVSIALVAWVNLSILAFAMYWFRRIFIIAPVMLLLAWFIYLYHDCMARNVCP
jgi:hypothetical protein